MSLGSNIQYLRKINRLNQEQFAEKMNVSRQTVSRWESNEVTPELNKLVDMCTLFSCNLDTLVRGDITLKDEIYSEVTIRKVPAFRMARYVMVSPNPEADVLNYMKEWGKKSGLLAADPDAKLLGFQTNCSGVEYCQNSEARYAVITVKDPQIQPFERIPAGYKIIMDYLQDNNISMRRTDDVIGCFEHEYEKDGVWDMDIYICIED